MITEETTQILENFQIMYDAVALYERKSTFKLKTFDIVQCITKNLILRFKETIQKNGL
jgi:hypothetical protein